ncbi:S-layer homology domain-containing protein [Halobacillus faecis]
MNITETIYKDVKTDDYLQEEVTKAKSNGTMLGVGNDKFNPERTVTRQNLQVLQIERTKKRWKISGKPKHSKYLYLTTIQL